MKCKILYKSKIRLRVHPFHNNMSLKEADIIEYYFRNIPQVKDFQVFDRTSDVVVLFRGDINEIINAFASFHMKDINNLSLCPLIQQEN